MINSIGNKIKIAIITSISVVTFFALLILFINQYSAVQNQQVIQTMTMEYSIISLSDELIRSYIGIFKNQRSAQFMTNYQLTRNKLLRLISTLKTRVISSDSKLLLIGVENTVNQVVHECDIGMKEIQENNFVNFSDHLFQANKNNDFVRENTSGLLQKELEYLSANEIRSEQLYAVTFSFSLGIFAFIVLVMIFFARSFSNQLITPLSELSLFAKDIASGNFKNRDNRTLKITPDETGSLTESIYTMVDKLIEALEKEQKTSEELKKTSETINDKNTELQRINSLMVGRELKMAELKGEIEELKKKLNIPNT